MCSEGGRPIRKPLALEVVRLIDAVAAQATREQLAERVPGGGKKQASHLVPSTKEEVRSRLRAQLLWRAVNKDTASIMPPLSTPADVLGFVSQLRTTLSANWPQFRTLMERPGTQEFMMDIQWGLLQRMAARAVKLFSFIGGGGGEGAAVGAAAVGVLQEVKVVVPPRPLSTRTTI